MVPASDLMLIFEKDPRALAVLQRVGDRLGCDRMEAENPAHLDQLLAVRRPTLAVMSMDCLEEDGLKLLHILAQHDARPATLLIGSADVRVLAGVRRIAEARGLPVIGMRSRPLDEIDIERLLLAHVQVPPPVDRSELEQALAEHEFVLQYQPKITVTRDGLTIEGVEALVRWRHPRRGQLLPHLFLPAIEHHGMLTALADFVIVEAIRQAGAWNNCGIHLQMVINLSPHLVKDRAFPDRLSALLREHELAPGQIVLDVTETVGARDRDLILDVFTRLRLLGIGLSLDNFGTGFSSLSELYQMPFSEVKIDRTMLGDVSRDRDAEEVVRAIVNLAHALRITVCAAGVEDAAALEFVRSAGFDFAQGRLFCGPVSPPEIEQLIAAWPHSRAAATGTWRALRRPAAVEPVESNPRATPAGAMEQADRAGLRSATSA